MATKTTKPAYRIQATTGIAERAYGENIYLALHAPDAPRTLATERHLAAATYRAAAAIEERILDQSTCAVCVETGRIHLEFGERASQAEQDRARAVLDQVASEINQRGSIR